MSEQSSERSGLEVAVVGMAGRFPGAPDIQAFWSLLREGREGLTRYTRQELLEAGADPRLLENPAFVPVRGELAGADELDAALFGLTPRDAEVLNPQHRLLLECAWSALEHAGYDPYRLDRAVGVFAGCGTNAYVLGLAANPDLVRAVGSIRLALGNDKDHLAAGVAYRLNLRGPALAVQTACSTSLVAVHLACQSLINGECEMALAGGVSVQIPLRGGYVHSPDGILSPDGRCRAFDAGAKGSVGGSGAGVVLLKRLDDALDDGDTIHAVIRGSAINNDGSQKVGYTAPSVTGQARVLAEAWSVAGVDPSTLQYLETHGTGTPLGDAIELKAMGQVLAKARPGHRVAIGSVKSNVGHLDAAAGIAGLIKTVLALEHAELPPSLHCATPHPEIEASGGRVAVNTQLSAWDGGGAPRRAGVSSFGLGGTNAHVVLEEAPAREPSGPSRPLQLLVLSARTPTALAAAAGRLADFVEREDPPLADAAFTLRAGRREMEHRLSVVCSDAGDAAERLRAAAAKTAEAALAERPVAFLFPGLGTQYPGMGRGLYQAEPAYRAAVDQCCDLLRPVLGCDLRETLFPPESAGGEGGGWDLRALLGKGGARSPLDDTRLAQPAVFVTGYALARLWESWGVAPGGLLGHSLGEYVAACVAGVFRLDDALRLVAERARLLDALPEGAMLAVPLSEDALREILPAGLDVAAVNTPESCVVSGPVGEVEAFQAALAGRGTVSRRLAARHAFHSRAMAPVAAELERLLSGFELKAPSTPFVSNVTGTWITDDEARSPGYWARHLRQTVRFADGVATLRREPGWALLEVGPGQALGAWAMQHPAAGDGGHVVLSSLRHPHNRVDDLRFVLETLGGLWSAGVPVDWDAFGGGERRRRIPLPGYPFERQRYWVEAPKRAAAAVPVAPEANGRGAANGGGPHAGASNGNGSKGGTRPHANGGGEANGGAENHGGSTHPHPSEAAVMQNRIAAAEGQSARYPVILGQLKGLAAELTGIGAEQVQTDVHFFQAGIDSLLLLQAIQAVEKRIGVRLSLVEMLEEMTTLDAVALHIDRVLPAEATLNGGNGKNGGNGAHAHAATAGSPSAPSTPSGSPAASDPPAPPDGAPYAGAAHPAAVPAPPAYYPPSAPPAAQPIAAAPGDAGAVERVIAQQLQLMAQQLATLRGEAPAAPPVAMPAAPVPLAAASPTAAASAAPVVTAITPPREVPQPPRARIQPETFVAYQPLNTESPTGLTLRQKEYLDEFVAAYTARTRASKEHQKAYNLPLADGRVTARFRRALKELQYPVVGDRAHGSRVWDLDGNEYVDVGMAYGCCLFGHGPEFASRAIQDQVERGYGVGPQSPLAGRAAQLVCEVGGNERAVFCNSGTEAVMGAIRAARTFTGRSRIAYFAGSYHGWSDVVQGRPFNAGGRREVRPTAPGIPADALSDVMILEWDNPASLERLAECIHDVALVMTEPVQSRRPDIQPRAFLHELRRMTREAGALLLFDELITGFRILPGGAQSFFGVDADLVTYGKIVAGGLPMGVVAGKREVMDVFDGGTFAYGDDSYPTAQRTLFAGAFFKHPLSMAVAVSILEEIQRRGPEMYASLNERADRLIARMNAFFEAGGYPINAVNYGSVFRFFLGNEVKFPELFNYHLVHNGVHVLVETGTNFLSDAHTDDDLELVYQGVCRAAEEMRRGGFIPPAPGADGGPAPRDGLPPSISTDPTDSTTGGTGRAGEMEGASSPSASSVDASSAIEAETREDGARVLPLTEGQRQLWIESQMGDDAALAYIESMAARLRGPLDVTAMRRALQALVDRHDTLRTTFGRDGDVQVVHPALTAEVPLVDFGALPTAEREARLEEWLRRTVGRAFDLENGPLVRFALASVSPDDHLLSITAHHAVLDGHSFGVLVQELGALYTAAKEGRAAELPPPPDHAAMVRAQAAAQRGDAGAEAFWVEEFAGGVPVLELPTDRPRPAVRSYAGDRVERAMRAGLMEELARVARQHGLTMFNTLLSALSVWLGRVAGQDDVVIGTPSAGQAGLGGAEGLVGYAINVLPLRVRIDPSAPFVDHAKGVRRSLLRALEHQSFSFPRLVETLLRGRDPSRPPFFSVLMNLDRAGGEARVGDLRASFENAFGGGAKLDLVFDFTEEPEGLRLRCVYSTALFDRATVEGWLASFERLLEEIAARAARDPRVAVADLPLAGPAELRLLEEWNRTARPFPRGATLPDLFARQVRANPHAPALAWEGEETTYAELDARANRLARHLAAAGVGPECRVGVLLERGAELVETVLAIVKAGGCYVPLDPGYPPERLALMLADAGATVLVTRGDPAGPVADAGARVLRLDAEARAVAAQSAEAPEVALHPENLAYIVYTSGSTGKPKGVMVAHREVVQLVVETDFVTLGPGDRVAQASNPSFDALTFEMWGAFLNGATLVGIPRDVLLSPAALKEMLRRERVTTLYQTTALLNQLTREEPEIFSTLREVLFGGQAADAERVRSLLRAGKPQRLLHVYGPTETTCWTTCQDVRHVAEGASTVSVGRPIGNARVYLLDGGMNPVPAGVPGEAFAGGDGIVRGYLGRPALTAERFLPDPFSQVPGARMYRTGDRLRWRSGAGGGVFLEFLARVDDQVKIRGFRIEPGEVEAALSALPGVREARVVVREDAPGEKRLVAYVVGEAEGEALRAALRRTLPEYMVPASVVCLPRLPLTPNGKLDAKALPAPDLAAPAGRYVAPETETEQRVAGIWAEVLGVGRVGLRDGFFDLGGHSLLAIRVVARVREAFGAEVPLRALFEAPELGAFAARVAEAAGGAGWGPITRVARGRPLPLSHAQQRLWFIHQMDPADASYNVPLAIPLRGALDADALERALGELVRRHEALRTTFRVTGEGNPVQVVEPAGELRLERVEVEGGKAKERGERVGRLARAEAARPFDLTRAPLLRATLLRLAEDDHVLLLTLHHVATDGWSAEILAREAVALYAAFSEGRPSPLAEPALQYADYAAWEREWLSGEVLEREVEWWRARLAGAPELLALPTDRPRPRVASRRGGVEIVRLGAELADGVRSLAQREGCTPFMVLLAAWQALLGRYAGQDDVVVGTTVANRARREVEEMVGLFMNALALRGDLSGDPEFRALLARVRDDTVDAFEHQHVPFDRVVEAVRPGRSLSHEPLFQVLFELHRGRGPVSAAEPGRRRRGDAGFRPSAGTHGYDLTLTLFDEGTDISGVLHYAADLFDPGTAARMLDHFQLLLRSALAGPGTRLSELGLLAPGERELVTGAWNRTGAPYPHATIHALFEEQADAAPDAVAVVIGGRETTYAQLDAAANRVARFLRARGIGPEDRVALCLERGPELMPAFFGILKSGAAYVPLDPAHPAGRLEYMLADSGARLLLTQASLAERLPAARPDTVFLDEVAGELESESPGRIESGALPENLAYVYYTSGSTGRPKGVAMHHYGPANYFAWGRQAYRAAQGHGAPVFSSMAVDLTLASFIPLFAGERVELLPEGPGVEALAEAVRRRPGFAMIKITPTHLALLNEALSEDEAAASAATLVIGADNLTAEPTLFWRDHAPGVRLLNEYGPTETVVGCSLYELPAGAPREGPVPIGRPISNLTMYVLDGAMRPVPPGVPGELYIGGVGVARGYLGRPGLTAEKFVPDPFGAPAARLYRTGDRARFLDDGNLQFLGRVDFQVKVRGYRIETGEVEAVLRAHPGVREAIVAVREDAPGDRRLVAYVVAGGAAAGDLRQALRDRLPEYMVPSAFVFLDEVPVGSTGKVDRKALPAPPAAEREGDGYVAPSTAPERAMAEIWEEVLGVSPVGVDDDFFLLGGHSMLAVRLMTVVRRRLGVQLALSAVFERPTVRRLAELLEAAPEPDEWSPLVAIQPAGDRAPLFLVHPIGGQVLCYAELARQLGPDQPVYGLQAPDLAQVGDHHVTLEEMAARYVAAIREVWPRGPYLLGGWSFGGLVAFEMAQQLKAAGEQVPLVAILDTASPELAGRMAMTDEEVVLVVLAHELALKSGAEITLTTAELRGLDRQARVVRALDALRDAGVLAGDVDVEWVHRLLDGHRARSEAMGRYQARPYPGRLVLFRPSDTIAGLEPVTDWSDPAGWRPYTTEPLVVETVPGHHATMATGPQAAALARRLRAAADDALSS